MSMSWRITCFGPLQAVSSGQAVTHYPALSAKLLLASLAIRPEEPLTRAVLGERLWPEEIEGIQRERLRWPLSKLRELLDHSLFVATGKHALSLAPGTTSDVAEFDALIRASLKPDLNPLELSSLLQRAEALHKAPFLADLNHEWVEAERTRRLEQLENLRQRVSHSLPALAPTPSRIPSNDTFFGREKERQVLEAFLHSTRRLVTLTGTGGIGKTRLVRETLLPEALLFVPMASLSEASGLFDLLRERLKLPASGYGPVEERVVAHLKTRGAALLILDNAEQIAPELAPLVARLLESCPELRLAVTSRRALKLEGEEILRLEPLSPRPAEALFLERARNADPCFATTPDGLAQVGPLCQLLEGIPLALEIAAARALLVSPRQMRQELEARLRFLVRQRGGEARHLSVRAALEWSYDLLSPEARNVFRRCGVFRGGFTLPAARFVFGDEPPALDILEELILHSLLKPDQDNLPDHDRRYTQLELVREYAEALLKTIPPDYEQTRAHHADFYLLQARWIEETIKSGDWVTASSHLNAERHNLNTLVNYSAEKKHVSILHDLLHAITVARIEIGHWTEADNFLQHLRDLAPKNSKALADSIMLIGIMAKRRGDTKTSWECWYSSLDIHKKRNDPRRMLFSYLEILYQALDEKKVEICKEILIPFELEFAKGDYLPNQKVMRHVVYTRYYSLLGESELASQYANETIRLLDEHKADDREYSAVACHIIRVLIREKQFYRINELILPLINKAIRSNQSYTLGALLLEAGHMFKELKESKFSLYAYWYAMQIHEELGTQFLPEAKASFHEIMKSFENSQDHDLRQVITQDALWRNLRVASDLQTLFQYNRAITND